METLHEYNNCVIRLAEPTQTTGGEREATFSWSVKHYGKEISFGVEPNKADPYRAACLAADTHLSNPYRFQINFVGFGEYDSGDVVTKDGEFLGRWKTDENDHASFYPIGDDDPLFFEVFLGNLARRIAAWHEDRG